VNVTDSVTAGSAQPWSGGDTLTVTSPASVSNSIKLATTCTYLPLSVTNPGDQSVTVGSPFSVKIPVSGGNGHYTFSWSSPRGNLPKDLTLNSSTGVISGTPQVAQAYFLNVTVTDTESSPQTASTGNFYINVNGT
jgi:hypothetical protein